MEVRWRWLEPGHLSHLPALQRLALWQPAQAASPSLVPSQGALSLFTGHWVQAAALPCLIVLVLVNTLPLPSCLTPPHGSGLPP